MAAECWCCGRERPDDGRHTGRGLCARCYARWQGRGFTGPGPGPEWVPQAERAREYAHIITALSAAQSARALGVSSRTVTRWRKALRQEAAS